MNYSGSVLINSTFVNVAFLLTVVISAAGIADAAHVDALSERGHPVLYLDQSHSFIG